MFRIAFVLSFLASIFGFGQSMKLPERIDVKAGELTTVKVEYTGPVFRFYSCTDGFEAIPLWLPGTADTKTIVLKVYGRKAGTYKLQAFAAGVAGASTLLFADVESTVVVSGGPPTPEPVPPGPGPAPPVPPPVPPPIPPVPPTPDPDPVPPGDPDDPGPVDAQAPLVRDIKANVGTFTSMDVKRLAKAHVDGALSLKSWVDRAPTAPVVSAQVRLAMSQNGYSVTIDGKKTPGLEIPKGLRDLLGAKLADAMPVTADHEMTPAEVRKVRAKLLEFARALQLASK